MLHMSIASDKAKIRGPSPCYYELKTICKLKGKGSAMRNPRSRIGVAALTLMLCVLLGTPAPHALAEPTEGEPVLETDDAVVLDVDASLSEEDAPAIELEPTDPVQPDPVQPDPVQPDPVQPDPVQPDAIELGNDTVNEPPAIQVQSADTSGSITSGALTVTGLNANGVLALEPSDFYYSNGNIYNPDNPARVTFTVANPSDAGTITVTSSDPSTIDVSSHHRSIAVGDYDTYRCEFTSQNTGAVTITAIYTTAAGVKSTLTFSIVCYPSYVKGVTAVMASAARVKITWDACPGASGYRVYSWAYDSDADKSVYTLVATVKDAATTTTTVAAPWGEYCTYCVVPYLTVAGVDYGRDANEEGFGAGSYGQLQVDYPTYKAPTVKKAANNKIALSWKKIGGVTGYKVYRCAVDEWGNLDGTFKAIKTVKGSGTLTATVTAPWETNYAYAVAPYLTTGGKTYESISGINNYDQVATFALPKPTVRITSVAKSAANKLTVTWKADKGATSYELYRSTLENSGYKKIATMGASETSKTVSATPGKVYYFKVVAIYGKVGSSKSGSFAQQIPVADSGTATTAKAKSVSGLGAWYDAGYVYTYVQGSNTYVAYIKNRTLTVVGYDKNLKQVSKQNVKLAAAEIFAGIYHGPDNNNYVVTGASNPKESTSKVVITVTQYTSAWKKGKAATIKGSASNSFKGIYAPFAASSIALDMQGTTLYLMTGRTMFQTSDGLHHQSNIGFKINTKTMKAKTDNISYCSHSFGQRVRFKDGTLYVADHGDAYPRAMKLTWQEGYGTKAAKPSDTVNTFKIVGAIGNNYTGATLGDMEVSNKTVLLCGASVPQDYGVKNVKGADFAYQRNLYLTVTNRTTGKTSVKWLTAYNPKGKTGVASVSMVKLSDQRFGILYTVINNGKSTLKYMVVDGNGKKVFTRTISGACFQAAANPVYANGRIYWASYDANYRAKVYSIQAL